MLTLPQIIDPQNFYISKKFDKAMFIEYAYSIFKKDFIDNIVNFQGYRVFIQPKLLNCFNCGFNCNNEFTCNNCPWINKEDIFQHITSYEDNNLPLSYEYRKKRKGKRLNKRTPGVFSENRTRRISWIKYIIENNQSSDILVNITKDINNKKEEKIRIYHKYGDFLVILSRTKTQNGNFVIYLNSAYDNPPSSYLKCFK